MPSVLALYIQVFFFYYLELNHHHVLFLFRSESSQVFVIVVERLYEILQHLPQEQLVIAYDSMCHLVQPTNHP